MARTKMAYGHGTGVPSPVDVHVGARLRVRRTLLGMTQTKLGDQLGVSFQQMQKYERGTNRISSSRLYDLARVLDVPIEFFFDEMHNTVKASSPAAKRHGRVKKPPSYEPNPMHKRETLELVRAYYKIKDADVRQMLYEFTKTLGAEADTDS